MTHFEITHHAHLHPPYGLWIVRHRNVVIGRRISRPNYDDCVLMLAQHREGKKQLTFADRSLSKPAPISYHLGGAEATLKSQRRGGHNKRRYVKASA